jgi:hypothetical protein
VPYDAYVQVARDNPEGKQVDMDLVATAAGSTIYRQRAVLVGDSAEILRSMLDTQMAMLACLRSLVAMAQIKNPGSGCEDEYRNDPASLL